jgi:hypothetical protein
MGVPPEAIPNFDLYAELEVAPTASTATIDAAWRSLVKRHHPDATGPSDAGTDDDRIRRLNIAHRWLVDGERRARYDHERAVGGTNPWSGARQSPPPPAPQRQPQHRATSPDPGPGAQADEARDWARVRRDAHRASRRSRMRRPVPLLDSPILSLALGVVAFAAILGLVLFGPELVRVALPRATPTAAETLTAAFSPTAAATADVESALAATLPDRVAGIELTGEAATGADVLGGDNASLDALLARTGGNKGDLVAAYKAGQTTGGDVLGIVALQMHSVDGFSLADAFRTVTAEDPEAGASWSDVTIGGRAVAVSPDESDPRFSAYLVATAEAMYLVLTSDPDIAEVAIRSLP